MNQREQEGQPRGAEMAQHGSRIEAVGNREGDQPRTSIARAVATLGDDTELLCRAAQGGEGALDGSASDDDGE